MLNMAVIIYGLVFVLVTYFYLRTRVKEEKEVELTSLEPRELEERGLKNSGYYIIRQE